MVFLKVVFRMVLLAHPLTQQEGHQVGYQLALPQGHREHRQQDYSILHPPPLLEPLGHRGIPRDPWLLR